MKKCENISPYLLGGDLNAYSVARAFFEAEGLSSRAFMRYKTGITSHVGFLSVTVVGELCRPEVLKRALLDCANAAVGERPLLVPCADWYTEALQQLRCELSEHFRLFLPPKAVWQILKDKASFYTLLSKHGILYPESLTFTASELNKISTAEIPYPAVLKPSDSTEYWAHPFDGMRKVYFPKNESDATEIAKRIFASGYGGRLILQRYVGKGEERLGVLTVYLDSRGVPLRAALADVLLEERGPTARGNHAALVTRPLDALSFSLIKMLRDIGYTGIANFDIIKDGDRPLVLECNTRQGRSCDYLLACGINIAALMLADAREERTVPLFDYPEIYWRSAPHESVLTHAPDRELLERAVRLRSQGLEYTPFDNTGRCKNSPPRRAYLWLHRRRQISMFDKFSKNGAGGLEG